MGVNKTCSKVIVTEHIAYVFCVQNCLKQEVLLPLLVIFALDSTLRRSEKPIGNGNEGGP
jgi:hypothetical protein